MINVLISDYSLDNATTLMNSINMKNENIKICCITKNIKETLEVLNSKNNIDLMLLHLKIPIDDINKILQKIHNKNKYRNSCLIITNKKDETKYLNQNNIIHSILYETTDTDIIINRMNKILEAKKKNIIYKNLRKRLIQELLYLGFNISYKGTQYLLDSIYYIFINQKKEIQSLTNDVYPFIAKKYNQSIHNVKCDINRATELMYVNCRESIINNYFGYYDAKKPNIKTIIFTIINKIS